MTKIFLDTADVKEISKWRYLIEGVTTNPSIIVKDGGDIKEVIRASEGLPISVEVGGDLVSEANKLRDWLAEFDNIVYKVPFLNAGTGKTNLEIIKALIEDDFKINVTAVLSLSQFFLAARLYPTYISTFGGRIEDEGGDLYEVVNACQEYICTSFFILKGSRECSEQIVGSVRNIGNVQDCIKAEVDIMTLPPSVLEKMIKHSYSLDTSRQFESDYVSVDILKGISESNVMTDEALGKLVGD